MLQQPSNSQLTPSHGAAQTQSPLARFMELRGKKIFEGCGSLWHSVEGGLLMSFPYDRKLDASEEDLKEFLRSTKAKGLRFSSLGWRGTPSGAYVCSSKPYDLKLVHHSFRAKVRKGLTLLEIRPVTTDELALQGPQLNSDTLQRQGRGDHEFTQPAQWKRFVSAVENSPGITAMGAFDGPRLAAYIIICRDNGVLQLLHQMSRSDSLSLFPNHALTFEVTRQGLDQQAINALCYGLQSIVQTPGLHNYKLDFGYEFVSHNSVITLHPMLSFLSSGPIRSMVRLLRERRPSDQRLERIDTVLKTASLSRLPAAA